MSFQDRILPARWTSRTYSKYISNKLEHGLNISLRSVFISFPSQTQGADLFVFVGQVVAGSSGLTSCLLAYISMVIDKSINFTMPRVRKYLYDLTHKKLWFYT